MWVTEIFVGDSNTAIPVLMDTATDLFAIDSDDCDGSCTGITASQSSTTADDGTVAQPIVTQVSYGERALVGELVQGKICLDQDNCVEQFDFLYLIEPSTQYFDPSISGVMGLARPHRFALKKDQKIDYSRFIMEAVSDATIFTLSFNSGVTGNGDSSSEASPNAI